MPRWLVVNADDFGQSEGVNRGIVEAHEGGVVTSASLMVRWPAAEAAAAYAESRPQLGLGLHLDLGEWLMRDGAWEPRYEVVPGERPEDVRAEVRRQVDRFRELTGAYPTHLDSHQHVHLGTAREATLEIAREIGAPVRGLTDGVRHRGDFYGQDREGRPFPEAIGVEALMRLVRQVGEGITEIGCHPGYADEGLTTYAGQRAEEIRTLCDPRVREAIEREGITLCSFEDAPTAKRARQDSNLGRSVP